MNITFITSWDTKGEQFNGRILHDYLIKTKNISHMLVNHKLSTDDTISLVGNKLTRLIDEKIIFNIEKIFSIWSILPLSGTISLLSDKSDIIHLQDIHSNSFISLLVLPIISKQKKVIMTVHDLWIMSGHCIYPLGCKKWQTGCDNCCNLKVPISLLWDTTSLMWKLKYWVMHHSNIHLIVASHYMKDIVKQSPILNHLKCDVIPYGIEQKNYNKKECRKELNIPDDVFVASYRNIKENCFKGTEYIESLPSLNNIYIFPIGGDGWIDDHEYLMKALTASDIFLMPSIEESFGIMAIESMSVGTPPIVFDGTALPEIIKSGGLIIKRNSDALLYAIQLLQSSPNIQKHLSINAKNIIKEIYTIDKYINAHINLYKSLTR